MNPDALKVAVVGHTNTGKTSLLRTLTRDIGFGDISAHPGTTRHVEGTELLIGGEPRIELYDTPGLEDSATLLSLLDAVDGGRDDLDRLRAFLDSAAAHGDLEQEAKVLRQTLASDILLYVIDAREPMLGRHRDELTVLGGAARPIIPVLNFTADADSREAAWREHLARINLHAVVAFDTVLFNPADERRLFEAMQALLAGHYDLLQQLIEERARAWQALKRAAAAAVADMLLDAAAVSVRVQGEDAGAIATQGEWLQQNIRAREDRCIRQLLEMFAFRTEDVIAAQLPIRNGRWQMDLFAVDTLRRFGLTAGGGAVAGAVAGLGVDIAVGGLSLGLAATLGAALGALWSTASRFGRSVLDRLRGYVELRIDDNTLRLLAARELELITTLLQRGHASLRQIALGSEERHAPWQGEPLPAPLRRAREHPEWVYQAVSAAGGEPRNGERSQTLHTLQKHLLHLIDSS